MMDRTNVRIYNRDMPFRREFLKQEAMYAKRNELPKSEN